MVVIYRLDLPARMGQMCRRRRFLPVLDIVAVSFKFIGCCSFPWAFPKGLYTGKKRTNDEQGEFPFKSGERFLKIDVNGFQPEGRFDVTL